MVARPRRESDAQARSRFRLRLVCEVDGTKPDPRAGESSPSLSSESLSCCEPEAVGGRWSYSSIISAAVVALGWRSIFGGRKVAWPRGQKRARREKLSLDRSRRVSESYE